MDDTSLALVGLSDGTLCAIRLISGQVLWKRKYPSLAGSVKLIYHDGLLFSISSRRLLVAYRLTNSNVVQEWETCLPSEAASGNISDIQMLVGKSVVVVRYGSTIFALDVQTGSQRWSYHSSAFLLSILALGATHVYLAEVFFARRESAPAIFGGSPPEQTEIRQRSAQGKSLMTSALALADGSFSWQSDHYFSVFPSSEDASPLLEADHCVYIFGKGLHALNADTGTVLWSQEPATEAIDGMLATDARRIFLAAPGHLGTYQRATGERIWAWPAVPHGVSNPGLFGGMSVINDTVYVGHVVNNTQGFQIEARSADSGTIQAHWPDDVTTLHPDFAWRFSGGAYGNGALLVIPSLGSLFAVQFSAEHTPRLLWRRRFRNEAPVVYTIVEAM